MECPPEAVAFLLPFWQGSLWRTQKGKGEREREGASQEEVGILASACPGFGGGAAPLVPSLMGDKLVSTAGEEGHGQTKALGSGACFQGVVSGSRSGNDFRHRLIQFSSSSAE